MDAIALSGIIIWNLIVFAIYGTDKYRAKNVRGRVSEKTLILCAFLMGAMGAFIGMVTFRHKTRKRRFKIAIPLAFLVNLVLFILIGRM